MPPAASQDTFIDELELGARNWERKLDGDAGSVCLLSGPKELPIVLSGLLIITIVQYTAIDPILIIRIKPPKLLFWTGGVVFSVMHEAEEPCVDA